MIDEPWVCQADRDKQDEERVMSKAACAATPSGDLERQIMDPNIPKNEREWWAAREIERLRERHGWQNIDTVPKDGTIVDLWHVKGFRVVDEWWDAEDGWTGGWLEDQFTHWMKPPIANP